MEDARRRFLLRPMDSLDLVSIQDTEGAAAPFFSPDGTWLGYVQDQEMKRMRLSDGSVQTITRVNKKVFNIICNKDEMIYWSEVGSGVKCIPARGGEVQQLTTLSEEDREQWQIPISFDEKGDFFSLTSIFGDDAAPHAEIVDLRTGTRTWLHDQANGATILKSGHMVYTRRNTLLAARADWNVPSIVGAPVPIIENVETDFGGTSPYSRYRQMATSSTHPVQRRRHPIRCTGLNGTAPNVKFRYRPTRISPPRFPPTENSYCS
ncbi:MAG: hypothetical protein VCD00_18130 [Candidatus Hydrogenedentota bacterium]